MLPFFLHEPWFFLISTVFLGCSQSWSRNGVILLYVFLKNSQLYTSYFNTALHLAFAQINWSRCHRLGKDRWFTCALPLKLFLLTDWCLSGTPDSSVVWISVWEVESYTKSSPAAFNVAFGGAHENSSANSISAKLGIETKGRLQLPETHPIFISRLKARFTFREMRDGSSFFFPSPSSTLLILTCSVLLWCSSDTQNTSWGQRWEHGTLWEKSNILWYGLCSSVPIGYSLLVLASLRSPEGMRESKHQDG